MPGQGAGAQKIEIEPHMRRDFMRDSFTPSNSNRRLIEDRRSGTDTRSDAEKQTIGERRFGVDRRTDRNTIRPRIKPADEQLGLFVRRLRRALASERGRDFFGVARGEYDFAIYPDVLRTLEWLETLAKGEASEQSVDQEKAKKRASAVTGS
jgi:hypothetical protein